MCIKCGDLQGSVARADAYSAMCEGGGGYRGFEGVGGGGGYGGFEVVGGGGLLQCKGDGTWNTEVVICVWGSSIV